MTMGASGSAGMEAPMSPVPVRLSAATWRGGSSSIGLPARCCSPADRPRGCGHFQRAHRGAIFAMEVILVNVAIAQVAPVLIASAAAFLSSLIYRANPSY